MAAYWTPYPCALARPPFSSNQVPKRGSDLVQSDSNKESDLDPRGPHLGAHATWLGDMGGRPSCALGPGEGLGSLGDLVF